MSPETRVSFATTARLAFAYVATADATLQANEGVKSTFANPRTPELPKSLATKSPVNSWLRAWLP
jgi:hypothetical protein